MYIIKIQSMSANFLKGYQYFLLKNLSGYKKYQWQISEKNRKITYSQADECWQLADFNFWKTSNYSEICNFSL